MNALEHNTYEAEEVVLESDQNEAQAEEAPDPKDVAMKRKSILDRFGEKLKEFLDNA